MQDLDREARLSLMLQRYDKEAADAVLEPVWDHAGLLLGTLGGSTDAWAIVPATVLADPRRAVGLIEALPEDADLKFHRARNGARRLAAQTLTARTERRWDWFQERFLMLWFIDKEDL